MARPLRIEFAGALYHVTSRGDRQEAIYEDDEDRLAYLEVLGEVIERFGWICHAYCLMGNHYHLVIETAEANLSKGMRQLNGVYTQISNRRHRRVGHLFQGRYKAILVDRDAYWLEVNRYVVLNPVRAGMVKQPGDWRWSSFNATVGVQSAPAWLKVEGLLAQFGEKRSVARRRYKSFVEEGIERESLWSELKGQIYLGDERFVERTQARLSDEEKDDINIPRVQRRGPAPPLKQIEARHKERTRAVVAAYETGEYSYQQIGEHFGVHFTTVGRLVRAARRQKMNG
ncbi:MAG TPA: addiction module toxin RelE [Deltaproteobacteria bacterium]|nr:MAG: addiction module toxin RelE [Deltaproteobacteria bacterium GWD2_55_8]HBA38745.1 addiction module toxin RelE [Deltaproteobacteria bacterium]